MAKEKPATKQTIPAINAASLALLALGGLVFALIALRARAPVTPLLGATLLVWWLFVNKIYSPQYGLWVYLALALLATSRLLWGAFALFDAAYYFASFQILYTAMLQIDILVEWQTRYLVHPLVAVRLVLGGFEPAEQLIEPLCPGCRVGLRLGAPVVGRRRGGKTGDKDEQPEAGKFASRGNTAHG